VTAPETPAPYGFDQAKGKIEYAGEAAGDTARALLDPPRNREPGANAVIAAVGTVGALVAVPYKAISAGRRKLSPDQLAEAEANLGRAMSSMADQKLFRDQFLKAAGAKSRGRLLPVEALHSRPADQDPVSAMLQTRVEGLRLERAGSSDTSFALRVTARARLVRAADGTILFDRPFEYRTGQGLFLDWTLEGVFQKLTTHAYRKLAEQMVAQLFATPFDQPVLVGAGYKKSPAPPRRSTGLLVAGQPARQSFAQWVNHPVGATGPVGIFSLERPFPLTIQVPLTKADALSEAVRDVDWSLDGLQDSHNPIVCVPALAAAIPLSLWKQTVGAVLGLSQKQYQNAFAQLSAAGRQARPQEEIVSQVAQQLAPRTAQPVMLANAPLPQERGGATGPAASAVRATFVRNAQTPRTADGLAGQMPETALQIQVLRAGLKGKEGINPRLALCVEAQITLWRVDEGRPLGSFPVHYRSGERKFVDWAAHDARLLRQELEQCSRDLGRAMVDQLAPPSLLTPDRARTPLLADK